MSSRVWRRVDMGGRGIRLATWLMLAAALTLTGCVNSISSSGVQPFAKSANVRPASARDTASWPKISIDSFSGLPEGRDEAFLQALAAETYRRQIALVNAAPGRGIYGLRGSVSARNIDGRIAVSWTWEVKGWSENRNTSLSGQEFVARPKGSPLVPASVDPWTKVDDFMLRRVAINMAELLSGFFNSQGYVTQTAGLPPPVETFVRAGPGAAKDIDLSLLGPNELAMRRERGEISDEDMAELGIALDDGRAAMDSAEAATPPESGSTSAGQGNDAASERRKAGKDNKEKATNGPAIRSVAVASVTGAPGDGNRSLALALQKFLRQSGWPVKDKPAKDSMIIEGSVGVSPPRDGAQQVHLQWTVKDPAGKVLGSMKQANQVPAGSLDKAWGLTAEYAAEAAGMGIFELVDKLR